MKESENENPKVADLKIPLWVKIMWTLGIIWILAYIWGGLNNSPTSW